MADVFTPEKRSDIMSRIKGEDTKPEIAVRKVIHSLGYRFRLHSDKLPGKPDVVLPRHRKIVLIHGCFWHGHARCRRAALPSTNTQFWQRKLSMNRARDTRVVRILRRDGWKVLVIWQCQTRDAQKLRVRLKAFLAE